MAGNHISRLPTDLLMYMSHIKKVDLRMNKLQLLPTETAKFHSLEHVTHIDIRDNQVSFSDGWLSLIGVGVEISLFGNLVHIDIRDY